MKRSILIFTLLLICFSSMAQFHIRLEPFFINEPVDTNLAYHISFTNDNWKTIKRIRGVEGWQSSSHGTITLEGDETFPTKYTALQLARRLVNIDSCLNYNRLVHINIAAENQKCLLESKKIDSLKMESKKYIYVY